MNNVIALSQKLDKNNFLTMRWLCPVTKAVKEVTGDADSMFNRKAMQYTHLEEVGGQSYLVVDNS